MQKLLELSLFALLEVPLLYGHPLAQLTDPEPEHERIEPSLPTEQLALLRGEMQGDHAVVHSALHGLLSDRQKHASEGVKRM